MLTKQALQATSTGIILLALTGCAPHLTLQQCKTMNWYQVGYRDGQQGKYQRDLKQDIADCARFKLKVNVKAYQKGWRVGTREFCRPSNGLRLGVNGHTYNDVCPANLAGPFRRAWRRGLRRYCVPSTGYNLGRAGKPFPQFCPPDKVVPFRNAYDKGFRIFSLQRSDQNDLMQVGFAIDDTRNQIATLSDKIGHWRNRLSRGFRNLPRPARRQKRRRLHWHIRQARNQIRGLQLRLNELYLQRNQLQQQLGRLASE